MNKNIRIIEVTLVNSTPIVRGTFGAGLTAFEAVPFQWGGKMLMKVSADGLDRGTRVAIGIKSKAALRMASLALPVAVLKRVKKVEAAPVVAVPDYGSMDVKTLRAACKEKGIKGYSDLKKVDLVVRLLA
jgi:hypothetical protein